MSNHKIVVFTVFGVALALCALVLLIRLRRNRLTAQHHLVLADAAVGCDQQHLVDQHHWQRIINDLKRKRLAVYDPQTRTITLTTKGFRYVERRDLVRWRSMTGRNRTRAR